MHGILRLTDRPRAVAEIADEFGLSQSSAYRKVGRLEDVGLLEPMNPDVRDDRDIDGPRESFGSGFEPPRNLIYLHS